MPLSYSYIDGSSNIPPADPGLGIYTGKVDPNEYPKHIKPEAEEYMKHFGVPWQIPGYTRLGNNTTADAIDNKYGVNCRLSP